MRPHRGPPVLCYKRTFSKVPKLPPFHASTENYKAPISRLSTQLNPHPLYVLDQLFSHQSHLAGIPKESQLTRTMLHRPRNPQSHQIHNSQLHHRWWIRIRPRRARCDYQRGVKFTPTTSQNPSRKWRWKFSGMLQKSNCIVAMVPLSKSLDYWKLTFKVSIKVILVKTWKWRCYGNVDKLQRCTSAATKVVPYTKHVLVIKIWNISKVHGSEFPSKVKSSYVKKQNFPVFLQKSANIPRRYETEWSSPTGQNPQLTPWKV